MRVTNMLGRSEEPCSGYAHVGVALGTEAAVDALTARLRADGYKVVDGPRRTGDGYYESVVLGPEGNRVELTV
jgi:lactoylglutathione lyase